MNLAVQFGTLSAMAGGGMLLGIIFDAYRTVSAHYRFPRWILHGLDGLYWIGAVIFIFRVLYEANLGEVRGFVFVGLVLGTILHFWITGSVTRRVTRLMIDIVEKAFKILMKLLHVLVVLPLKGIYKSLVILAGFLAAITVFISKIVLKCFYPIWKLVTHIGSLLGRMRLFNRFRRFGSRFPSGLKRRFRRWKDR